MIRPLAIPVLALALLTFASCSDDDPTSPGGAYPVPSGDNVVLTWNASALQAIRDTKPGPPQAARSLAVVHTAMFDAWAAYDETAVGTRLGGDLRRPLEERTEGRKAAAVSYAAHKALIDQYPSRKAVFDDLLAALGYDPANLTTDRTTPEGIGNVAAAAVIAFRHSDGSNQLGDLGDGTPYSDYTYYQPANPPIKLNEPTRLEDIPNPGRWQPLTFTNPAGVEVTPKFIAPHWNHVIPFAMTSPSQFRPGPPSPIDSPRFREMVDQLIAMSAQLTDEEKCIAEYWADGPNSELPPGHFDLFAHHVSKRDGHSLDQDVKLFFAVTNAVFDAGIAAWDAKVHYDFVRPVTAIRYLYHGEMIEAWGGPGEGAKPIPGETWKPFQPDWFPTPPFAEYVSGHSTFSAAAAEVMRSFKGNDDLGYTVTVPAFSLKAEPGISPRTTIVMQLSTFTEAAAMAGISRRYGGIHFEEGDLRGREMGKRCGAQAWAKAQTYFEGTAGSPAPLVELR